MGSHDTAKRLTFLTGPRPRAGALEPSAARRLARPILSAVLAAAFASVGLAAASAQTWDATVAGELLEVVVENEDAAAEEHVVVSDDGAVSSVDAEVVEDIEPGSTVEVTVSGSEVEAATLLAPAEKTVAISTHHAYVVAIDDASATGDVALADAVTNAEYAADYWVSESRGAIGVFDVVDSSTLAWDGSCSATYSELWSIAAAEFPGVSFSGSGNHLIVYTPGGCSYSYAGVATVGSMSAGGYVHISSIGPATTVHEIGHNLGLGHSNALWGDPYGSYGFAEYYGVYGPQAGSVGSMPPGGLDAAYRYFLDLPGWEAGTETLTVDPDLRETHTVTLTQTTSSTGVTSVTLVDPSDGYRYFLDFRSAQGVDASAFYALSYSKLSVQGLLADYSPGIVVTWMPDGRDVEVIGVVDGSDLWTSFQAGDSYTAPDRLFTMNVLSTTTTTATVEVITSPDAEGIVSSSTSVAVDDTYEGSAPTVNVSVDATRTPAGSVDVYLDGAFYAASPLSSGDATVTLPSGLDLGQHDVRAVYQGSDTVESSEGSETFSVLALRAVTVSAFARPAWVGGSVRVTATVEGAEAPGGTVTVSYGGSSWTSAVNSAGVATLAMPTSWTAGERNLTVAYSGSASAEPADTTVTAITMVLTPAISVVETSPAKGAVLADEMASVAATAEPHVGESADLAASSVAAELGAAGLAPERMRVMSGTGTLPFAVDQYTMRFLIR